MPDQLAEWRVESGGEGIPIIDTFLQGTEGWVEYKIDSTGDKIRLGWDLPAVGRTGFPHSITGANGGPSDFVWFTLHLAFDGSREPPPGQLNPLVAVVQGDLNEGTELILPIPVGNHNDAHAWFDIGIRDIREPVSVRRWLK